MVYFENKKTKNCVEKRTEVNIDAVHIYPETLIRIVNNLVVPSKSFLTLAGRGEY